MARLKGKYLFSPTDEFKNLNLSDFASVVDAFERRIKGWFFNPIEELLSDNRDLFAATAIECMLVDAFAGFWFGVKESKGKHFVNFLVKRMGINYQEAEKFYDRFRCGILHQTNIKEKSCISEEATDLVLQGDVLFLNPRGFYERLRKYFENYLHELRSRHSCEPKFKKRFYYLFKPEFSIDEWKLWWAS